jgi:hypothetical protein
MVKRGARRGREGVAIPPAATGSRQRDTSHTVSRENRSWMVPLGQFVHRRRVLPRVNFAAEVCTPAVGRMAFARRQQLLAGRALQHCRDRAWVQPQQLVFGEMPGTDTRRQRVDVTPCSLV